MKLVIMDVENLGEAIEEKVNDNRFDDTTEETIKNVMDELEKRTIESAEIEMTYEHKVNMESILKELGDSIKNKDEERSEI
jgi:hypothetical protein